MPDEIEPTEVHVATVPVEHLFDLIENDDAEELRSLAARAREVLDGRVVWNISSTATGGGVAEMLHPLLAYGRGAGVDLRWLVLGGDDDFFEITKRIHHGLHGEPGSTGDLGEAERAHAEDISRRNFDHIRTRLDPDDLVICHDPQTAWLVPLIAEEGVPVVWRCHIGTDRHNEWTERAWRIIDCVEAADRFVFSREVYIPKHLADRSVVIPPSIDPLSCKNADLEPDEVRDILVHIGLLDGSSEHAPAFRRGDGTPGRIDHVADVVSMGPPPDPDTPMVVQVSRWDPLKDMGGVMQAFSDCVEDGLDAHLVLAGPTVSGVADDPEGAEVLEACIADWHELPDESRSRITLACLPMADVEENAVMVNALQRHATVVVQKSLQEGFGLTVSEAMWKGRPVVAGKVGGIQDQVVDGEHGFLVDPEDLEAFGAALTELLSEPERAAEMGAAGRERVRDEFLGHRHLRQYAELLVELAGS